MLRNNLAKLMIDRGISATQLFNDTGIARSTISKISNNNTDKINLQTIEEYEPGIPFNNGYLDSIVLDNSPSETSIFDNMPVQFQNELVEEVKEKLSETFEVLPFSPTIENLDLFTLSGLF